MKIRVIVKCVPVYLMCVINNLLLVFLHCRPIKNLATFVVTGLPSTSNSVNWVNRNTFCRNKLFYATKSFFQHTYLGLQAYVYLFGKIQTYSYFTSSCFNIALALAVLHLSQKIQCKSQESHCDSRSLTCSSHKIFFPFTQ